MSLPLFEQEIIGHIQVRVQQDTYRLKSLYTGQRICLQLFIGFCQQFVQNQPADILFSSFGKHFALVQLFPLAASMLTHCAHVLGCAPPVYWKVVTA